MRSEELHYKYKYLSDLLGMNIQSENQYNLALAGASKKTVEDNIVLHEKFYLTEEYAKLYPVISAEEMVKILSQL
jgi:hypothetical protein